MDYQVRLLKKEKVAKDAYSFYFERPTGFDFIPGQYLKLTLDVKNPDERGNHKLFSIASSPSETSHLMISSRIIQSAFKNTLNDLESNSLVNLSGPFGVFVLNEKDITSRVFLAGGIGVTPFRSMIKYAADNNLGIPITLFTSFRTVEDIVFRTMFQEIVASHSWFKLIETITRPEESKLPWNGLTGRIDANLLSSNVKNLNSNIFYIAGPPQMVQDLTEIVKSLGVAQEKIKVEKFTGY